jgi:hypothetical protein
LEFRLQAVWSFNTEYRPPEGGTPNYNHFGERDDQ